MMQDDSKYPTKFNFFVFITIIKTFNELHIIYYKVVIEFSSCISVLSNKVRL